MTKLDSSIYKRRNNLLRQSKVLQAFLIDNDLQFDKYYKMKMQQEDAYKRWRFFNYMIRELTKLNNKKDPK